MPEHDHGPSRVVLIPTGGELRLRQGENEHSLSPGTATDIGVGERVSLANCGLEPATLLVVATPPDFVTALSTWPPA
jgi:quercetin dioxygenase-like cupin family protein